MIVILFGAFGTFIYGDYLAQNVQGTSYQPSSEPYIYWGNQLIGLALVSCIIVVAIFIFSRYE